MKTSPRTGMKPLLFFDSCALVKLFVNEDEPATTIARRLWNKRKEVYGSIVSIGEVLSVFAKKKRCNCLLPTAYDDACKKFIDSLQKSSIAKNVHRAIEIFQGKLPSITSRVITLLPLSDYITSIELFNMVNRYHFEFGDAWHLTALLSGLEIFPQKRGFLFVSSDGKFCDAVEKEGYTVLDLRKDESPFLKDIILGVERLPKKE
ncbi:MAG TPA: type II toxin-antitoxin system VapC family toxin [Desulfatiglandales bacterium]|nr:type II toxin-antitoxin system VapC family toxin [Desulfatiglandales bacterium]